MLRMKMAWLEPEDMKKREFELFVIRRKDDGRFYKRRKVKGWGKDGDKDDVNWTDDVEAATFYAKRGIKQALAGVKEYKWDPKEKQMVKLDVEMEIVTLRVNLELTTVIEEGEAK